MRLPTSLAVTLSGLAAALAAVQTQIPLGRTLHLILGFGLVFLAGLGIHPQTSPDLAVPAGPYSPPARQQVPPARPTPTPPPMPAP